MTAIRKRGFWTKVWRYVYKRLVVPILRARNRPHHSARGVFIGVFVALTPTVGIQMPTVLVLWFIVRFLWRRYDFNLLIAMAWTGVTNIATVAPFYFAFLATGWVMLGRFDHFETYAEFSAHLTDSLDIDATWYEAVWVYTVKLFYDFGIPLFLGSVPWAVIGGLISYRWTLTFIADYRERRMRRRAAAAAARA